MPIGYRATASLFFRKISIFLLALGMATGDSVGAPGKKETSQVRPEISKTIPPKAANRKPLRATLDTSKVRNLYIDGEFPSAIEILESSLKDSIPLSHTDSVFIFKHLGVMYAADYEKRERGKMFMFQLLTTEPTAKILDMYASDMIYMIFKNIQDEFETKKARLSRQVPYGKSPEPNNTSSAEPVSNRVKSSSTGKTLIWIGATGAVIAAGFVAYIAMEPGETKITKKIHYPE